MILEVTEQSRFKTSWSSLKAAFIFRQAWQQVSSVPGFALSAVCFHIWVGRALLVKMLMNLFLIVSSKHTSDFVLDPFSYIALFLDRIKHVVLWLAEVRLRVRGYLGSYLARRLCSSFPSKNEN